jgi:uncharacterized membrane protein YdfJ with MMPL/SSD domain
MGEAMSWLSKAKDLLGGAAKKFSDLLGPAGVLIENALGGPDTPESIAAKVELERIRIGFEEFKVAAENIVVEANAAILMANAKSYQAELAQDDKYTKRWRPTLGYILGVAFFLNLIGLPVLKFIRPEFEPPAGNMQLMVTVAALLGVGKVVRGREKEAKIKANGK